MHLSVQLDSKNTVRQVTLDTKDRLAYVLVIRPDGTEVVESVTLTEAQLNHLGGGEMVQIKFSDGQQSQKLEPWYVQRDVQSWQTSLNSWPIVVICMVTILLILGLAVYWRRVRWVT